MFLVYKVSFFFSYSISFDIILNVLYSELLKSKPMFFVIKIRMGPGAVGVIYNDIRVS